MQPTLGPAAATVAAALLLILVLGNH